MIFRCLKSTKHPYNVSYNARRDTTQHICCALHILCNPSPIPRERHMIPMLRQFCTVKYVAPLIPNNGLFCNTNYIPCWALGTL